MLADALSYKDILDNLHESVYFVDVERRITYWNKAAVDLTGYTAEEVLGHYCWDNILKHIDEKGIRLCHVSCPLAETIADGRPREAEVYFHHKHGYRVPVLVRVAPIRDSSGQIVGGVEVFSDNSPRVAFRQMISELEDMALVDTLVELPNRRYVERTLEACLDEMRRFDHRVGILLIDIDHFKKINDTYGHGVGDQVLKMVARTLSSNVRSSDTLGRWGGEEFVAIIKNINKDELYSVADRFRLLVERSALPVASNTIAVTVSIGAALAQEDDNVETIMRKADQLMYQSKVLGRNRVVV